MKNIYASILTAIIFVLQTLPAPTFAQRGLQYKVSLQKQLELSGKVIEGKVVHKKSVWNSSQTLIYTINTVEVYKTFKGSSSPYIKIITLGGSVGNHSVKLCPELKLHVGDVGVFILKAANEQIFSNPSSANTQFEVVSESQGFYRYDFEDDKAINPFLVYKDISNSFYKNIELLTGKAFVETRKLDIEHRLTRHSENNARISSINSITPTSASAGTKTVLTIEGSGFGTTTGSVGFKDADSGGATYFDALSSEIISWNDDKIEVYIPSHAGTGTIRVTDASSGTQESAEVLTITFAQLNGIIDNEAYVTNLIDASGEGGYVWHMFTDFDANTPAKKSFLRAFNTWICYSKINWTLGATTSTDKTEVDGENVIRFDNGNELPLGVLGRCISHEYLCDGKVAIIELDMIIDDETNWNFGPELPGADEFDFESMVVHELGHGHQLAHVIDPDDIMYYGERGGDIKRELSDNDKAGADYVHARSTSAGICTFNPMQDGTCQIVTGIKELKIFKDFNIYPNPAFSTLYVENDKVLNGLEISIFDLGGKKISSMFPGVNTKKQSIDISNLPHGVYILSVSNDKVFTREKIIVK